MRVAIVSPYSWTYPGGVNRHVDALAHGLIERGHEVRVLAPWDPPDAWSRLTHRSGPVPRGCPEHLIRLGRTVAIPANGAVSNLSLSPGAVRLMRRELAVFGPDVVHVHEPFTPLLGWHACRYRDAPVVGTFHAYDDRPLTNLAARALGAARRYALLRVRIAVSEPVARTGRRRFGGLYQVIPNGVDITAVPSGSKAASDRLRVLFVGRPEPRKGLPVLAEAFERLIASTPAELWAVGVSDVDIRRWFRRAETGSRVRTMTWLDDAALWRRLHEADVLCAPSLAGESFGMVLVEAFAAGTPVVASDIPGYRHVVRHEGNGVLTPAGDPERLAAWLRRMHDEPRWRERLGIGARDTAHRYAWPHVVSQVERVYRQAMRLPRQRGHTDVPADLPVTA